LSDKQTKIVIVSEFRLWPKADFLGLPKNHPLTAFKLTQYRKNLVYSETNKAIKSHADDRLSPLYPGKSRYIPAD